MAIVTVAGAHGQTVTLNFDTNANAALAGQLAAAITAGVEAGSIVPVDRAGISPPPLDSGKTGELVQQDDGLTILPHGYKAVVNTADEAVIFGSGDADESVLSSSGNLSFFATGGSGTVAAGGGNNRIVIPGDDDGDWSINTGNGNDTLLALGGGDDSIAAGGGRNEIELGSGKSAVQTTGDDTVDASSGSETIAAFGTGQDLIFGHNSQLFYVGNSGTSATVFGGTGSDTFFGGGGPDLVYGGTGGNNYLFAGTGQATLFGGGNGDQLYAAGGQAQVLHAGSGTETLSTKFAFGHDTVFTGTGSYDVTAGQGDDTFVFSSTLGGGSSTITGFGLGADKIDLQGYDTTEVANALKHQKTDGTSDTIKLSDNTTITFAGISNLTASDFITTCDVGGGVGNGGGGGGGSGMDHGGNGHGHGHGSQNGDDHGHMKDAVFKPNS
jgi:Ca2+-binding RTX toxin-like protein